MSELPDGLADGDEDTDRDTRNGRDPGAPEQYDRLLAQLDGAISEITEKIENGRIRDPEKDKVRIQYYRALGYLVRTKRQVLEDQTREELAAEIEELRDLRKSGEISSSASRASATTGAS